MAIRLSAKHTDHSGTFGSGASILVSPARNRAYLRITNPSGNTGSIWWNEGAAAVVGGVGSVEILQKGSEVWEGFFVPAGDIWIIGTTSDKYLVKEA